MKADTQALQESGTLLGAAFAQGFADGIETNAEKAALAAERMALRTADKVRNAMQIQSPSKVMHALGAFTAHQKPCDRGIVLERRGSPSRIKSAGLAAGSRK